MLKRDRIADELATLYLLKEHVSQEINCISDTNAGREDLTVVKEKLKDCKTAIEFMNNKIDEVLDCCDRGVIYYSKELSN
ncbi:hypothetical protein C900_01656 [Fulvivirga imtechensis AK7]|uniref:Uncharacterized protein n=1 Tax=Fulvivirga imtechensis AK7 TaxID=1237149 RepID=L8JXM1_9BACT|nr:hypothetical protein [Fulvivirga imtechensis]ELR72374.1 hypothetical protein C900_01656 [Fulvivirga imtechensis AK7]